MNHQERCRAECTRDVIFLFQVRRYIATGYPYTSDGEYCHDGDGVILGDVDEQRRWTPREGAEHLTTEQLLEMTTLDDVPCLIETWETASVYLTREEAESFGRRTEYNYRDGWRVYGVPANGKLAALLTAT